MMMVMSYTVDGKEYLVLNASEKGRFLPGMAGVRLLADHQATIDYRGIPQQTDVTHMNT